jgi:polyisoprenoid-binding protein YceI
MHTGQKGMAEHGLQESSPATPSAASGSGGEKEAMPEFPAARDAASSSVARYRFDRELSRFRVQAYAAGLLAFLGHNPTFAVRGFSGFLDIVDGKLEGIRVKLAVKASSLVLVDALRPAERAEIEERMRRAVLETAVYPEIAFQAVAGKAATISPGRYRLPLDGRLTLHGVTRRERIDAELLVFADGVRLRGDTALRLSDYRIRPVTALGGTIKLKDELSVSFDLVGLTEGPENNA